MINELANNLVGLAEIGGNQLLSMDESALQHCAELQGHVIAIELVDLQQTLYIHPGSWGLRLSLQAPAKEIDATIRGRLLGLMSLSRREDKITTSIQERIEITGNARVAQKFQRILGDIDIDWEEQLAGFTGDIAAFRIAQGINKTRQWVQDSLESLSTSGREYLQEELRYTPTLPEFEHFRDQISTLRHNVDRLEALIKRAFETKQ